MAETTTRLLRSFLAFLAIALMLGAIYGVNRLDEIQEDALFTMRTGSWHLVQAEESVLLFDAALARHRSAEDLESRTRVTTAFYTLCNRISVLIEAREMDTLRPRIDMATINTARAQLDRLEETMGYLLIHPSEVAERLEAERILDTMRDTMTKATVAAVAHLHEGEGRQVIEKTQALILSGLVLAAIGGGLLYALFLFEKKLNNSLLDQARASAQTATEANQAKTRFLASASHDLRQPLNALCILLSMLQRRMREPRDRKEFDHCLSAVDQISRQLDLYLDITRIDSGNIVASMEMVEIDAVIASVHSTLAHEAEHKGLNFSMTESGMRVMTDPRLIERVIANLAGNAVRHTASGFVLIRCMPHGTGARLDIIDTGPGIPANRQSEIFQEFVQIDNPARQMKNGYGLGLAIVRRLMDLLGHQLEISSEVGRGTTFSIRIEQAEVIAERSPATTWSEPAPFRQIRPFGDGATITTDDAPAPISGDGERVLIIEDDQLVASSLAMMISDLGKEPIVAHDAATAVAAADGGPISTIIADYRLSGADGLDAIARIRSRLGPVPAFLVTGDIGPEVRRKADEAGVPYLKKPVTMDAISGLLDLTLPNRCAGRA